MQMRKREMSPCRVPYHLGRMGLVDVVVVGAGGVAVEGGAAVAGAEVVAEEPELSSVGMSQTWGWPEGQKNRGDKFDQASVESTGRRRRHDTLRNALLEHGDPGG
jgi:hypothetical protein